jgi:hypothetical protein
LEVSENGSGANEEARKKQEPTLIDAFVGLSVNEESKRLSKKVEKPGAVKGRAAPPFHQLSNKENIISAIRGGT